MLDAGESPDAGSMRDAGTPMACDARCAPLLGYPIDEARGCVETSSPQAPTQLGCRCPAAQVEGVLACSRRLSDDTLWATNGPLESFEDAFAWAPCSEPQAAATTLACAFADCPRPPASTCDFDTFCQTSDCSELEYDGRGCRRPSCATDGQCADDERCAALECTDTWECNQTPSGCDCRAPAICLS